MSTQTFNTFALAGAGLLGGPILKELSKTGKSTIVLTRSSGSKLSPELSSLPHVTAKPVDYTSEDSLVSALKGVDVVISTLSGEGFGAQPTLIKAAKKAGIKVFAPSQFGIPVEGLEGTPFAAKAEAQKLLREVDLPYALFVTGGFTDFTAFVLGLPSSGEKSADIVGKGETPLTLTSIPDIARFVAHVVTTLPPEKLQWAEFRIEGDQKSAKELAALVSKRIGKDLPINYRDYAKTKAEWRQQTGIAAFRDLLLTLVEDGKAVVSYNHATGKADAPLSNNVWPEWNPQTAEQVIAGKSFD